MDEVTLASKRRLKESDRDIILKLTACCMLILSKKGSERVQSSKAVCFNESDFVNWSTLEKNCNRDKLLGILYKGETLFEHPPISGDQAEGMGKKKANTKKIRLNQNWLNDAGFEILTDDLERDVIREYLERHPKGRVFTDNGGGKAMTEIISSK